MAIASPLSLHEALNQMDSTPVEEQAVEPVEEQPLTEQAEADPESDIDPDEQPLEADSDDVEDGESPEEHDEPEEDDEDPTFTFQVEGKEVTENLEGLQQGYMRTADYTRKTQELSEHRKVLGQQAEQVQLKLGQLDQELASLDTMLVGNPPQMPPVEWLQTNPTEYETQKRAVEEWNAFRGQVGEWRQKLKGEREQAGLKEKQETIQAEAQELVKAFELKDQAQFMAKTGEIQAYLISQGYKPERLQLMLDHKDYILADKARKYDELMAKNGSKAALKAKKARVKSSSSDAPKKPVNRVTKAKQRFHDATKLGSRQTPKSQMEAALDAMEA